MESGRQIARCAALIDTLQKIVYRSSYKQSNHDPTSNQNFASLEERACKGAKNENQFVTSKKKENCYETTVIKTLEMKATLIQARMKVKGKRIGTNDENTRYK